MRLITVEEILYFRSDQKYTLVVTEDTEALIKKTIKSLISHKMESGQRKGADGNLIPRSSIKRFTCDFNGVNVIDVTIEPAVSTNPYFEFDARIADSGEIRFTWYDDDGAVYEDAKTISFDYESYRDDIGKF